MMTAGALATDDGVDGLVPGDPGPGAVDFAAPEERASADGPASNRLRLVVTREEDTE